MHTVCLTVFALSCTLFKLGLVHLYFRLFCMRTPTAVRVDEEIDCSDVCFSHTTEVAALEEDEHLDKVSMLVIGGMLVVSIPSTLGVCYRFWASVLQHPSD